MPHFLILNGPNVNRLGKREPEVFGRQTLTEIETDLFQFAEALHIQLTFFQSNHEGDLIDAIHEAEEQYSGIVLNPGAPESLQLCDQGCCFKHQSSCG